MPSSILLRIMKKWYRSWFNSPYYHILYAHRDYKEAELFIDNIYKRLQPEPFAKVLDACCGRGRHSIYLNEKGLDVTGVDLSASNIKYAKQYENQHLRFFEHDIRNTIASNIFDYVLNIFTSFGYFKRKNEDLKAFKSFHRALKPGGYFLIDFLNVQVIQDQLKPFEQKTIEGIEFNIEKKIDQGLIKKSIRFVDEGVHYEFKEEVKALSYSDLKAYCQAVGFEIVDTYGDYQMRPFDLHLSERLIILAQKK